MFDEAQHVIDRFEQQNQPVWSMYSKEDTWGI